MDRCVERVWHSLGRGGDFYQCQNRAKVVRDGKGYCGVHDPERTRAKQQAREAGWKAQREAQERLRARGLALCKRLRMGHPYYRHTTRLRDSGYTGGVVLTAEEGEALADLLEALDG